MSALATVKAPRVLIADDHPVAREGLASLLASEPGLQVVGTACDGLQAVEQAAQSEVDVVIMDIKMPALDGIEAAHRIKAARPQVGIVILSSHVYGTRLRELVSDGGVGYAYLLKSASLDEIKRAVGIVAQGGFLVDPQVAQQAASASSVSRLTPRERDVLQAIADGLDNAAIAGRLSMQPGTLSMHITSIYSKLGIDQDPDMNPRVAATLVFFGLLQAPSPR